MTFPTDRPTICDLTTEQQLKLWGCFVTATKYGGKYEGGRWTAFTRERAAQYVYNLTTEMARVGGDPFGDDEPCRWWWKYHSNLVGIGDTPDEAVLDLIAKLEKVPA